jgi:hypothetical protein
MLSLRCRDNIKTLKYVGSNIMWRVDSLLGNSRETSNYKTAVAR